MPTCTLIDDLEYFYDHENHASKTGLVSNRLYLVDEQSTHVGGNDLKPEPRWSRLQSQQPRLLELPLRSHRKPDQGCE
jgi:hypothetical protein